MASRRQRALPHAGDGEVARAALALFAQGSSLFCHLGSEPGKIRLRASRLVKSTGIMRPEPNGTGSEQAKQDVPKMTNEGDTLSRHAIGEWQLRFDTAFCPPIATSRVNPILPRYPMTHHHLLQ